MKDIKTSYFGNWRKWPKDYQPIGITNRPPPTWNGDNIKELAPSDNLLYNYKHGNYTEHMFSMCYLNELNSKFTPEQILAKLPDKCILLCYEKAGDFCHRHLLAEWLGYKDCEI